MKTLVQALKESSEKKKIVIEVSESAYPNVVKLLEAMHSMGSQGASRTIIIEDWDDFKVGFDGDGSDKLDILEK